MENELIRRSDVLEQLQEQLRFTPLMSDKWLVESCMERAKKVPAVDAVEVVRCRECIHSDDGWLCDSPFHGGRTFPDDYCSNGERREEEHNAAD